MLSYKNPSFSKPIPNIFEKLENTYPDAIQLLKSEKTQSETLANCYRNLSALNIQWQNVDLANSCFEKAKNTFKHLPFLLHEN